MMRKRRLTISGEGWYYLVVIAFVVAGAVLRDINLLMVVAGMMIGPLALNAWHVVASMRGIQVRRIVPDRVAVGEPLAVTIEVRNNRSRTDSFAIAVEDATRREAGRWRGAWLRASVLFSKVPPGETRRATYQGCLSRRGRYSFSSLRAWTRFPLGLVRYSMVVDARTTLLVHPRLGHLTDAWRRLRRVQWAGSQQTQRQSSIEGEFFGLRDWRPGDSRRWIHWRTSARRGSLVVRQFERQYDENLLLLIDLWQPKSPSEAQARNTETVLSFAATASAELCRGGGSQLCLGIAEKQIRFSRGTASMARLHEILEQLALVEATDQDCLDELLRQGRDMTRQGARVVLASTRPGVSNDILHDERFSRNFGAGQLLCIDATGSQLRDYFHLD